MDSKQDYQQLLTSLGSTKFTKLWDAQRYVLDHYGAFTEKVDVAIELPTGAGKTLIGLLIAEVWRRAGNKVAILSANKTLARQMSREADSLRIPAVLMEGKGTEIPVADKRAFQRKQAVAVMNYWVYFNQNPAIDRADLIIMDDAHLAEHCLHSLYSVEIKKREHSELFKKMVLELSSRFPEYSVLLDAIAEDSALGSPTELLSFIDQAAIADRLREMIDASQEAKKDSDFRFRWGRVRGWIREANIYMSTTSIWIRPYVYPLISNAHYSGAKQRLYVSATIGDTSDLSRRLGVNPIEKIPVPVEYAEKTSGRRLVVMNRIEQEDFPVRLQQVVFDALSLHPKSVWLCSSESEATKFCNNVSEWLNRNGLTGHPTWILTALGDEIEHFKASPKGHLFVGGRFDGMDFSADECRLVVVTTIPRAINSQEEFICAYLRDSGFMRRRLNQRIVQSLGRCNRSAEDFGIYVLADRRFATHFSLESNLNSLPRDMIAEFDMAQDDAEIPIEVLQDKLQRFLKTDFQSYDLELKNYQDKLPKPVPPSPIPDFSDSEVIGWAALMEEDYETAATRFEECWSVCLKANLREIGAFEKWTWAKALYLQSLRHKPGAREKALQTLEEAITRGGHTSWFNRMRASLYRATETKSSKVIAGNDYGAALIRTFDDILEIVGTKTSKFEAMCNKISANLSSGSHTDYCIGLEEFGKLLGYQPKRSKRKAAEDCLWRGTFGNTREVITFEAKIEHDDKQSISPTDVGQANNQFNRATAEYGPLGYKVRGTMVTHLKAIEKTAESSLGKIRIIEKQAIVELWDRLRTLLSIYRDGWSLDDIGARQSAAQMISSRLPPVNWIIRAIETDGTFLSSKVLLAEWP